VSDAEFDRLLAAWFGNMTRVLAPGRGFYIWGGYANCANYPPVLKASGLYFSQAIIWDKQHPVLTRKDFMGAHEWCFYGWKEGAAHKFYGPNNVPDLWQVKKVTPTKMIHLTEKPVELAIRAMQYSSRSGQNVSAAHSNCATAVRFRSIWPTIRLIRRIWQRAFHQWQTKTPLRRWPRCGEWFRNGNHKSLACTAGLYNYFFTSNSPSITSSSGFLAALCALPSSSEPSALPAVAPAPPFS